MRVQIKCVLFSPYLYVDVSNQLPQQDYEVLAAHRKLCKYHQMNLMHPNTFKSRGSISMWPNTGLSTSTQYWKWLMDVLCLPLHPFHAQLNFPPILLCCSLSLYQAFWVNNKHDYTTITIQKACSLLISSQGQGV